MLLANHWQRRPNPWETHHIGLHTLELLLRWVLQMLWILVHLLLLSLLRVQRLWLFLFNLLLFLSDNFFQKCLKFLLFASLTNQLVDNRLQSRLDIGLSIVSKPCNQCVNINIVIFHFGLRVFCLDYGCWLNQVDFYFLLLLRWFKRRFFGSYWWSVLAYRYFLCWSWFWCSKAFDNLGIPNLVRSQWKQLSHLRDPSKQVGFWLQVLLLCSYGVKVWAVCLNANLLDKLSSSFWDRDEVNRNTFQ